MLYRIYTENKNFDATMKLIAAYFPKGFTVQRVEGFYDGQHEHALIIDIVYSGDQHVYDLAWDIGKENGQESVKNGPVCSVNARRCG